MHPRSLITRRARFATWNTLLDVAIAGGDLEFLHARSRDTGMRNSVIMRAFYERFLSIRQVPVPCIAAVNGAAIGAGAAFALANDITLMARSAKLGVTFTQLGLSPGMGSTISLLRRGGPQHAARMILTGDVVSAEEAAKMNLVMEAVDDAALMPRALELAGRIAANGPVAVRAAVRSLRLTIDEGLDRALWREADAQSYAYSTSDFKEGLAAVQGKRKPNFTNYEQYKE